jgi:hypothetical protein
MAEKRIRKKNRAIWLLIWFSCYLSMKSASAESEAGKQFLYDIPSQSLAMALDQYAVISQTSVMFPSEMVKGRNSSVVSGWHSPEMALHLLLEGTGLAVEKIDMRKSHVFSLKEMPTDVIVQVPQTAVEIQQQKDKYDVLMQAMVMDALCKHPVTAAQDYRALIRLWINSMGNVSRVQLIGSTGNNTRDLLLQETIKAIHIGAAPELGRGQSFVMLILPGVQMAAGCKV